MKKPYQIEAQRAVKQLEAMAGDGNPAVQMMLPMAEVVGWLRKGVGELVRQAGLQLMELLMQEEVRELVGVVLEMLRERLDKKDANSRHALPNRFTVESRALAALALRDQGGPEYARALEALLACRNRDVSWPAFSGDDADGCWATALAVLALLTAGRPRGDWQGGSPGC